MDSIMNKYKLVDLNEIFHDSKLNIHNLHISFA